MKNLANVARLGVAVCLVIALCILPDFSCGVSEDKRWTDSHFTSMVERLERLPPGSAKVVAKHYVFVQPYDCHQSDRLAVEIDAIWPKSSGLRKPYIVCAGPYYGLTAHARRD